MQYTIKIYATKQDFDGRYPHYVIESIENWGEACLEAVEALQTNQCVKIESWDGGDITDIQIIERG